MVSTSNFQHWPATKHWLRQDFGDPMQNGLGHKICRAINPETQKEVQAVFIPKDKAGYWSGEICASASIADSSIIDDDEAALRKHQLYLGVCVGFGLVQ